MTGVKSDVEMALPGAIVLFCILRRTCVFASGVEEILPLIRVRLPLGGIGDVLVRYEWVLARSIAAHFMLCHTHAISRYSIMANISWTTSWLALK